MSKSTGEWSHHAEVINTSVKECYEELHQIWLECGYDEGICEDRRNVVVTHIKMLLSDMVKEETRTKLHLIMKVEEAIKEMTSLGKELKCNISTTGYENLPLNQMEKTLRNVVEELLLIKHDRQNKLMVLKEKEKMFCMLMEIDPVPVGDQLPTEQELESFRQYLNKREEEMVELKSIFKQKRLEIMNLAKELEWTPSLQFEKSVLHGEDSFIFSQENMKELENFRKRLETDLVERKSLVIELETKLKDLCDQVLKDSEYKTKFLSSLYGFGVTTVDAIKKEISQLEEIKRQNVKKFVEYARSDLEEWWKKCHYSQKQKQEFIGFYSDCYTEDLLELHELELQKVKQFYESNLPIFDLVQQRQDVWDKMLDVENRSHNKNRLFANRGGQLLQEERERKQIQKDLPKIEANLLNLLKEYERKHHIPFILNGEVLSVVIGKQWKEHQERKEQEKQTRKTLRDQESGVESKYCMRSVTKDSTGKHKHLEIRAWTPQSCKQTKLMLGKTASSSKSVSRSGKVLQPQDPACIRKAVRKSLRLGHHSAQKGCGSSEDVLAKELSMASTTLSYTHFECQLELLNTVSRCRSSMKSGREFVTPTKSSRQSLTPRNFNAPRVPTSRLQTPRMRTPQQRKPVTTSCLTTPRVRLPIIF